MQPPSLTSREFNFGVSEADAGTSLVFQWRESTGARAQVSLDAGFADPRRPGFDNVLFAGGQFAFLVAESSREVPLDFLLTAGAGMAIGNKTAFRFPVGVSVGHRFPLAGAMSVTPFIHPRSAIDICRGCGGDESQVGISVDLGAHLQVSRVLAVRGAVFLGGTDRFGDDGAGVSIAWTPPGLRR